MSRESDIENLAAQIRAISPLRFRTSKAEIVDFYRGQNAKRWRGPLTKALAPIAGMTEKNLQRRFDPSRLNHVPKTAREKQQYIDLGKLLPPIGRTPPPGGYYISFIGGIRISKECYDREFYNEHIAGEDAQELANDPSDFAIVFLAYFEGEEIFEDICWGEWVVSAGPDTELKYEKKKKRKAAGKVRKSAGKKELAPA